MPIRLRIVHIGQPAVEGYDDRDGGVELFPYGWDGTNLVLACRVVNNFEYYS